MWHLHFADEGTELYARAVVGAGGVRSLQHIPVQISRPLSDRLPFPLIAKGRSQQVLNNQIILAPKSRDVIERGPVRSCLGLNSPVLRLLLCFVSSYGNRAKGPRERVLKIVFVLFK